MQWEPLSLLSTLRKIKSIGQSGPIPSDCTPRGGDGCLQGWTLLVERQWWKMPGVVCVRYGTDKSYMPSCVRGTHLSVQISIGEKGVMGFVYLASRVEVRMDHLFRHGEREPKLIKGNAA